jgi:hypothetical protein
MPRTRAMGQSPGGFQALDMDAPARKRRTAQTYGPDRQARKTRRAGVSENQPAPLPTLQKDRSPASLEERTSADAAVEKCPRPAISGKQCSPPSKRRSIDTIDEERPTKRTRLEAVRIEVESAPKLQLQLLPQPEPEGSADKTIDSPGKYLGTPYYWQGYLVEITAPTLPINSATQNTPLESSKTLPLEAERTQTALGGSSRSLSRSEMEARNRSQRSFQNLARLARSPEPEDSEALSDCENDDDWNRRYKRMVTKLNLNARESCSLVKWSPDSKAVFAVKQTVSESEKTH